MSSWIYLKLVQSLQKNKNSRYRDVTGSNDNKYRGCRNDSATDRNISPFFMLFYYFLLDIFPCSLDRGLFGHRKPGHCPISLKGKKNTVAAVKQTMPLDSERSCRPQSCVMNRDRAANKGAQFICIKFSSSKWGKMVFITCSGQLPLIQTDRQRFSWVIQHLGI